MKASDQSIFTEMSCKREAVHICIVHLLRHSMNFASYKDRKAVAVALKAVYSAIDAAAAEAAALSVNVSSRLTRSRIAATSSCEPAGLSL